MARMNVTSLPDAEPRPRDVAVGTFDGVHVGHRKVIEGADTVLTFEPHPVAVVHPASAPKLLMPFEVKRDVIEGLGVSELVVIPFDKEFSGISPESFCDDILVGKLGAQKVSVGENFRFGKKAAGDVDFLGSRPQFETRVVPLVEEGAETVSSTRIRALIAAGEIEEAIRCLGAPFIVEGEVIPGDQRGRTMGFPTANLLPADDLVVPGHGVYAAFADGRPAAVSIGVRPTFGTGRALLIEAYLIDWEGDLYGKSLRIAFISRLRGERRFSSVEELISQMHDDVRDARERCANFTPPRGT